jgi:hypothetical protein
LVLIASGIGILDLINCSTPAKKRHVKTFANMGTMTSDWIIEEDDEDDDDDEVKPKEQKHQYVYLKRAFMAALPFYFFIFVAYVLTEIVFRYTFEEKFACLLHNTLHYSLTPTLSWENGPPPS